MTARFLNVQTLLWLALGLALVGSLKHLAAVFSSVDGNQIMGWVQAVAIDIGVFTLSMALQKRKRDRRPTVWLYVGISLFTAISVYGNLVYGLANQSKLSGNLPDWASLPMPYILAATLPILVMFLAGLAEDDQQYKEKVAKKMARETAKSDGNTNVSTGNLATVNDNRQEAKQERLDQLATIYQENPHATVTEFAGLLEVSRATVRNYAKELGIELNGKVTND